MIKKHYRKNSQARAEFEHLVEEYLKNIEIEPCSSLVSDPESFPGNTADSDLEFRKKRWRRLPGLQGAARFGRLLFVVCHSKRIVYLVWIYTHAEFQEPNSRPPDRELATEINLVKQDLSSEAD
ncbi:MAG: hypothetical protein H0X31_17280 [Nostocaceae cyanobacterium]|nr:hypothetical protein [Nostocaceae cyanobacterium]